MDAACVFARTQQPVRASCDQCRKRKMRCSGAGPSTSTGPRRCKRCSDRGEECTFSSRKRMGRPPTKVRQTTASVNNGTASLSPPAVPTSSHSAMADNMASHGDLHSARQHFQPHQLGMFVPESTPCTPGDPLMAEYIWAPPAQEQMRLMPSPNMYEVPLGAAVFGGNMAGEPQTYQQHHFQSTPAHVDLKMPMLPQNQAHMTPGSLSVDSIEMLDWSLVGAGAEQQQQQFQPTPVMPAMPRDTTPFAPSRSPSIPLGHAIPMQHHILTPTLHPQAPVAQHYSPSPHPVAMPGPMASSRAHTPARSPTPSPVSTQCLCHPEPILARLRTRLRLLSTPAPGTSSPLEVALDAAATSSAAYLAAQTCARCQADPSSAAAVFSLGNVTVQILRTATHPAMFEQDGSLDADAVTVVQIGGYRPHARTASKLALAALESEVEILEQASSALLADLERNLASGAGGRGRNGSTGDDTIDSLLADKLRRNLADVARRVVDVQAGLT